MTPTARRTTTLALALAALLLAGIPVATPAGPNLGGSFANPPYALAARCDPAQAIAFVNVVVANRGQVPTAAIPVTATDAAGVLGGSSTLLPIPPGAQTTLSVPLARVPSSLDAVGGTHAITVSLGPLRLAPLAVTIPPAFCAAKLGASASASQRARVLETHPLAATPGPWTRVTTSRSNETAKIIIDTNTPAAPGQLYVSNSPQECALHVGLLGALACPDMIRSGDVLLVWDWHPGTVGPGEIDGFRVYRVQANGSMKRLVYTRPDKKEITLYDLPGPSGTHIGECYAVSAYAGSFESATGGPVCLNRQNTIVMARPSVVPSPTPTPVPRHVVIHVTEDKYPQDTVVAAGGDVTWINDDTDAHSVYFAGGSVVGELAPNGGKFTTTLRDTGVNYFATYICEYHQNMQGRILVLR
jgi:plastocyanin